VTEANASTLCNICGHAVSTRKPEWTRLARPEGGYDHTHCALGLNTYGLQAIRREGRVVDQTPSGARPRDWVFWKNLGDGAWKISCNLCGKQFNRVFRPDKYQLPKVAASDYVGHHLTSAPHLAAVEAYKAPIAELPEERLMRDAFGKDDERPDEAKRVASARAAAYLAYRKGSD
jgi:hypothetical protein